MAAAAPGDAERQLSAAMAELERQMAAPHRGGGGGAIAAASAARRRARPDAEAHARGQEDEDGEDDEDDGETRDLAYGYDAWKNVPDVVRKKVAGLAKLAGKQAQELADLRKAVAALQEGARDAASQTWVETNVKKLSSQQNLRIEGLAKRVDQMRQTVDLKADAAYLTSCLLTKANKSDVSSMQTKVERAAERVETNLRQQHDDRWERLQRASEAYREGVAMQLQEALRSMSTQRASLEERMTHVQRSVPGANAWPDSAESGSSADDKDEGLGFSGGDPQQERYRANRRSAKARLTHARIPEDPTATREFNSLVRQVETLAAVQAKMQQVMQSLETRVDSAATRADVQSVAADKANKLSVANAIHRKANKDDLEGAMRTLTTRLETLEEGLAAARARPGKGDVARLRTDVDRALETLRGVPTLEQVGNALDKLAEELKPQIENALLGVDQLRRGRGPGAAQAATGSLSQEGASGLPGLSALEGRVRAANERCASLQTHLEKRLDEIESRLGHVEDHNNNNKSAVMDHLLLRGLDEYDRDDDEGEGEGSGRDSPRAGAKADSGEDEVAEDDESARSPGSETAREHLSRFDDLIPKRKRLAPRKASTGAVVSSSSRATRTGSLTSAGAVGKTKSASRLVKTGKLGVKKKSSASGPRKVQSAKEGAKAKSAREKTKHECAVGSEAREVVRERLQRQLRQSRR